MPKQGTNWNKLEPGDVISFRYQSVDKSKPPRTNTILVLNTKYQKNGMTRIRQGLKLYFSLNAKLKFKFLHGNNQFT